MIDKEIQLTEFGFGVSSVTLADAIKAFVDAYGDKILQDKKLVMYLSDCRQVRSSESTLLLLQKLIEDGITDWLLEADDNDDGLQQDIEDYIADESLQRAKVFKLCNDICLAINSPNYFA